MTEYPLPDNLYNSKDWRNSSYPERVQWLHLMYEQCKEELDRVSNDLEIANLALVAKHFSK